VLVSSGVNFIRPVGPSFT